MIPPEISTLWEKGESAVQAILGEGAVQGAAQQIKAINKAIEDANAAAGRKKTLFTIRLGFFLGCRTVRNTFLKQTYNKRVLEYLDFIYKSL